MEPQSPNRVVQAAVFALLTATLACAMLSCTKRAPFLQGAVLERNSDPRKQSPLAAVEVTASTGSSSAVVQTDSYGYFKLTLRPWIRSGQPVHLEFRHPGYHPLSLNVTVSDLLFIVDMAPIMPAPQPASTKPPVPIANVKIRYSLKSTGAVNVGSEVKAFEVMNQGNIPCDHRSACSPDGKWKAAVGSTTLEAGQGNEFRNARLSCIAGPCPFTRVESDQYSRGGNKITATVLNWSDTTTFLLEAEVYHPMVSEAVQDSYPVIYGETLNFSVPDSGEGVSIQADVNGEQVVFPIGPSVCLTWANCTVTTASDNAKSYRCQLKDGFEFR